MNPIIGLAGPIGSGKDTLALMLTRAGFRRIKFADTLYAMANVVDPAFHPDMTQQAKKEFVLGDSNLGTRRAFLEHLGTEFGRLLVDENFWSILTRLTILQSQVEAPSLGIVVSDVRFDNEANMIRSLGGHIVHIKPQWECVKTGHASDAGVTFMEDDSILGAVYGRADKAYAQLLDIIKDVYSTASASN